MSFNFDDAIKAAKQDTENKSLFLILLGASGNGKSYIQGTFGMPTLYLYGSEESHGPKSALREGSTNIHPICLDRGQKGEELTPDQALETLDSILSDVEGIKKHGYRAITIDSSNVLETLIRSSSAFKLACLTSQGKHNGFAEGPATLTGFRKIITKLRVLQRQLGIHVCVTSKLNISSIADDGLITDSSPDMAGYQVAAALISQFDDVLIIGKMKRNGQIRYRLQLLAESSKVSKDADNNIKRTFNFSPRITGVDILALGSTLDANLAALIDIKKGGK